eukprot:3500816-Amphidinium_carterae.2
MPGCYVDMVFESGLIGVMLGLWVVSWWCVAVEQCDDCVLAQDLDLGPFMDQDEQSLMPLVMWNM